MDRNQRVSLLGFGINSLGNVDDTNAEEFQLLHHPNRIGYVSGDPRAVVDEQDIEGLRALGCSSEQPPHAWTVLNAGARNAGVRVDVVLQNRPPALRRISLRNRNLVLQRGVSLEVAGVSGVNRYAHSVPM